MGYHSPSHDHAKCMALIEICVESGCLVDSSKQRRPACCLSKWVGGKVGWLEEENHGVKNLHSLQFPDYQKQKVMLRHNAQSYVEYVEPVVWATSLITNIVSTVCTFIELLHYEGRRHALTDKDFRLAICLYLALNCRLTFFKSWCNFVLRSRISLYVDNPDNIP